MKSPSGKFVLRVDPSLHRQLKVEAEEHGLSLNEWIIHNLTGMRLPSVSPLIRNLKQHFGMELLGVIQFGSSVRGEMKEGSDVDLLIVLDDARPIDRSLYQQWDRIVSKRDSIFSPQFSHLPKSEGYSSLWLETAIEGVVLFDPSGRVESSIRRIRSAISEGIFQRKMSHGHPYWVRKDDSAE